MILGLTRKQLEDGAQLVHATVAATPQYSWPLLNERAGTEIWVKHENHTPIGSFKVRGGLTLIEHLKREHPKLTGVISATRGNHGQSVAFAGRRHGLRSVIVVPHGNIKEKNAAMRAWGAELIEHGRDYDEAREHAAQLAKAQGLHHIGPFDRNLVTGVGSYALELFSAVQDLDEVYVPVGCGSGICGVIAWRDALGLKTRVVGVVSENAACYAISFAAGKPVKTKSAITFADGVAVRVPVPEALEAILAGAERIVQVSDDEVKAAMRDIYRCTHNIAEGQGPPGLALRGDPLGRQHRPGAVPGGAGRRLARRAALERIQQQVDPGSGRQVLEGMAACPVADSIDFAVERFQDFGSPVGRRDGEYDAAVRIAGTVQRRDDEDHRDRSELHRHVGAQVLHPGERAPSPVGHAGDAEEHQRHEEKIPGAHADPLAHDRGKQRHESDRHRQAVPHQACVVRGQVVIRRADAGQRYAGEEHPVGPHLLPRTEALRAACGALAPQKREAKGPDEQECQVGEGIGGVLDREQPARVGEAVVVLGLHQRGREDAPAHGDQDNGDRHAGLGEYVHLAQTSPMIRSSTARITAAPAECTSSLR